MQKLKVGLVSVMYPEGYNSISASTHEAALKDHQSAKTTIENMGFEVITASEGLTRTNLEFIEHGKYMKNQDVDVLVIYVYQWLFSASAVDLVRIAGVPAIVWTHTYKTEQGQKCGLVGGGICRGALDAAGLTATLVHGAFDDQVKLKKIEKYIRGFGLVNQLRNTIIGVGGTMSMGMFPSQVDFAEMQSKFGIHIDGWDERNLIDKSLEISDEEAGVFYGWMENEFGEITAKKDVIIAQIKMYLAVLNLIRENSYGAVCVRCLPELNEHHTTFCLAHAFLNGRFDDNGEKETVVCGCEADLMGTVTMQILKCVSGGEPAYFGDTGVLDYEDNLIFTLNCGSSSFDFAASRKDVDWVPEEVYQVKWKMGGVCPSFIGAPGRITIARLGKKGDAYRLMIASGELVWKPAKYVFPDLVIDPGIPACDAPDTKVCQFYVKFDSPVDNFVELLRSNHMHFVRGDYVEALKVYCEAAGIVADVV